MPKISVLGGVPRQEAMRERIGSASTRIEPEVDLDLVPQVLAEACSAVVSRQPGQERSDEAVVLIGRVVEQFVIDADRISVVEQVSQRIL